MADRLNLQTKFEELLGSRYVYFQPPESIKMHYPCIRYAGSTPHTMRANNKLYNKTNRYEGVVIDPDPESGIPDLLLDHFPMCNLGKSYTSDNLNHFPFTLYY